MKRRCAPHLAASNPKYAGRGITLCSAWSRYEVFREWAMAKGYRPGLSIERVDNDGDYEPGNCRWITMGEQAKNRRTSRRITLNGRTMILADWSRETGLDGSLIRYRIAKGWTDDQVLAPVRSNT